MKLKDRIEELLHTQKEHPEMISVMDRLMLDSYLYGCFVVLDKGSPEGEHAKTLDEISNIELPHRGAI